MQEDKNKVETVLFTTGRFINLEELGRLSGIGSIGYLKNVLEEFKNPALQHEIIKIRGNKAYDHIGILKELGFITSEPTGRSKTIKLTTKFYDYFDIVEDQLKNKLQINDNKSEEIKEEAVPANETKN